MGRNLDDVSRALAAGTEVGRRRFLGRTLAVLGVGAAAAVGLDPGVAEAGRKKKCPVGFLNCDGSCRDVAINPDHCGACGVVCPPGSTCRNGTCVDCTCGRVCPIGQTWCSPVCVNVSNDTANCGSCGHACAAGDICLNGVCAPPQCASPADCPSGGPCVTAVCANGVCGTQNAPAGTPVPGQNVVGDCRMTICNGNGGFQQVPDDNDLPFDGNECTADLCISGIVAHPPVAAGTPCTDGVCDGSGVCVPA